MRSISGLRTSQKIWGLDVAGRERLRSQSDLRPGAGVQEGGKALPRAKGPAGRGQLRDQHSVFRGLPGQMQEAGHVCFSDEQEVIV